MELAELTEVNSFVNSLPYTADAARYGAPDFWREADAQGGDCEDFAIAKLNQLVARGWSVAALRLATVWTERNDYHAVLVVRTGSGDVVLDNRHPRPVPVAELGPVFGYRPALLQKAGGVKEWVEWLT